MNVNFTGVCMNVKIFYDLFPDERSFEVLRDVDHEVAHLFVGVDDVDEINACLIVVALAVDVFYHRISEVVSQCVETIFGVISVRYFNEFAFASGCQVSYHDVVC